MPSTVGDDEDDEDDEDEEDLIGEAEDLASPPISDVENPFLAFSNRRNRWH